MDTRPDLSYINNAEEEVDAVPQQQLVVPPPLPRTNHGVVTIDVYRPEIDTEQKGIFFNFLNENFRGSKFVFHHNTAYSFNGFSFKLNQTIVHIGVENSLSLTSYTVYSPIPDLIIVDLCNQSANSKAIVDAEKYGLPILIKNKDQFILRTLENQKWVQTQLILTDEEIKLFSKLPFSKKNNTSARMRNGELKAYHVLSVLSKFHSCFAEGDKLLGHGAFATAYLVSGELKPCQKIMAYSPYSINKPKALKVIDVSKTSVDNIKYEYDVMKVAEMGPSPITYEQNEKTVPVAAYSLQDYVDGMGFKSFIADYHAGKYTLQDAVIAYTLQDAVIAYHAVLEAIMELHKKGIIHKDIKPENIKYNPQTKKAKLLDFGLSILHKDRLSARCNGTPMYVAPEIWADKEQDYSVDYYAAGVVALELFGCQLLKPEMQIHEWKTRGCDLYNNQLGKVTPFEFSEEFKSGSNYLEIENALCMLLANDPQKRRIDEPLEIFQYLAENFTNSSANETSTLSTEPERLDTSDSVDFSNTVEEIDEPSKQQPKNLSSPQSLLPEVTPTVTATSTATNKLDSTDSVNISGNNFVGSAVNLNRPNEQRVASSPSAQPQAIQPTVPPLPSTQSQVVVVQPLLTKVTPSIPPSLDRTPLAAQKPSILDRIFNFFESLCVGLVSLLESAFEIPKPFLSKSAVEIGVGFSSAFPCDRSSSSQIIQTLNRQPESKRRPLDEPKKQEEDLLGDTNEPPVNDWRSLAAPSEHVRTYGRKV